MNTALIGLGEAKGLFSGWVLVGIFFPVLIIQGRKQAKSVAKIH